MRRAACVLLVCAWGACARTPDPGSDLLPRAQQRRVLPSLLLSEVVAAEHPSDLLDPVFTLRNAALEPQTVALASKSCSCYGLTIDGAPFDVGQPVVIPPGESRLIAFRVAPPAAHEEKTWSARLTTGSPTPAEIPLSLTVHVHADVRLEPDTLFVDVSPPAHVPEPKQVIAVHRIWRADVAESRAPQLQNLPDWLTVIACKSDSPPQPVEAGLWQQSWRITLQPVSPRESLPRPVGLSRFSVKFPSSSSPQDARAPDVSRVDVSTAGTAASSLPPGGTGRLVVQVRRGLLFPPSVHWGQVVRGSDHVRRLLIRAADQRPFRIVATRLHSPQDSVQDGVPVDAQDGASPDSPDGARRDAPKSSAGTIVLASADGTPAAPASQIQIDHPPPVTELAHSVELRLRPQRTGPLGAVLEIETDHPTAPTIRISLRAFVVEPPQRDRL
jgi:hypothetical protein